MAALVARKRDELESAVANFAEAGVAARAFAADRTGEAAIDDVVARALAEFGRIDILVNNAGATWGRRRKTIRPRVGARLSIST